MGWNIGNTLGAVERFGARLGERIATSTPVLAVAPKTADRIDHYLQGITAPTFPRSLELARPTRLQPTPAALGAASLTAPGAIASYGIQVTGDGEARLDLTATAPGADWGKKGAESAVLGVYVDGKYQQDLVVWGGAQATRYALALGKLAPGAHTITLRNMHEKAPKGAQGVEVAGASVAVETYETREDRWAAEQAPILIGRHGSLENTHTDLPLAMYHDVGKQPDGTTKISYGYVFSNEDSGDGAQPSVEQARWGRLTDLETVYNVTLDANGKVLERSFEGAGHKWAPFAGQFDGAHPIIRTATNNNNVTDRGGGLLRFQFPTDHRMGDFAKEDLMRQNPVFFATEGKELQREGKIGAITTPEDTLAGKLKAMLGTMGLAKKYRMADPRSYVYVQLKAQDAATDPIVVRAILKDGTYADADLGQRAVAIARDGWSQTAIKLPAGVKPDDIARVEYLSHGTGRVTRTGHVYMLDGAYQPVELSRPVAGFETANP
ncbi:MAG: hypothetical protein JWM80_641 [Cyanobacteria bacterium RYN_339]|nr:hypothetical protein [Cyanobacteria bacterium RYN_339]